MKKLLYKVLGLKSDYEQLFFRNEYRALVGLRHSKLLRLTLIVFITFLALSFAKGSYNYLNQKMNNPFTNWLDVDIGKTANVNKLSEVETFFDADTVYLDPDSIKNKYFIDTISRYKIEGETFYMANNESKALDGRSIEPGSKLLKKILEPKNVKWHDADKLDLRQVSIDKKQYYDIIVSTNFLKKLEYNTNEIYKIKSWFRSDINFWLNIIAVVNQLPNNTDYLMFPNLMDGISNINGFIEDDEGTSLSILAKSADKETVFEKIKAGLGDIGEYLDPVSTEMEEFKVNKNETLYLYKFFANGTYFTPYKAQKLLIKNKVINDDLQFYHQIKRTTSKQTVNKPHYLAFNFSSLGKVRSFQSLMKKEFEIDVDMAQVESKENFAYVSALTQTVSFLLFLLGLFTIVIYLLNLLKTHLNGIKKNLGTYKAFGFSEAKLNAIYFKIILSKLIIALLIAFFILIVLQYSGFANWVLSKFINGLDTSINCISVFNYWNLGAIVILLIVTFFFNYQTIKSILSKTPGDLIYNRT